MVGIVGQIQRANGSLVRVSRRGVTRSDSLRPQADVRHAGCRALEGEAAGGRLLRPRGGGGMDQGGSSGDKKGGTSRLKYLVMGWGVMEGSALIRRIPA